MSPCVSREKTHHMWGFKPGLATTNRKHVAMSAGLVVMSPN